MNSDCHCLLVLVCRWQKSPFKIVSSTPRIDRKSNFSGNKWVSEWVSEWLLFKANYAILQLYIGIDKLILNMDYAENYRLSN